MQQTNVKALRTLKKYRDKLTWRQHSTLKGQILAGDVDGAMKGLRRVLCRGR